MKICMFTNTYLPHVGGVARSVDTLAEDLRAGGHEVLIVSPTFANGELDPEKEQHIIRVPAIQNFNGSDFSVRLPGSFQLTEALDDFQPDIVHSHHPFLLGDTAVRIARNYRIPVVFTHHTLYEKYTHYVPFDSETLQQFAIHLSTEYANLSQAVVAPSESIAALIKERGVKTNIAVIPTGVDLDFFASGNGTRFRKQHNISESAFIIGHLGRLAPEKNLDYLSKAVASALTAKKDACCVIAGDGPMQQPLIDFFAEKQLAERVIFTGNCTGQGLADVFSAMDLFVFASKTETQGMVLTEAMACAVPVVALDASGVREVVKDSVNGRLLDENASIEAFATAIAEEMDTLALPEDQQRQAALQTAEAFSRASSVSKMLSLYQQASAEIGDDVPDEDFFSAIDKLALRINAEWDLITQKASAAVKVLMDEQS